ncbi:MAG: glycosyltransferase [Actinomycetes bacterium]
MLTPSYQYARFLVACLRSVREQASPWPVQHVIVDDGSTDDSWEIIERERLANSSVLRQENQGLSRTLTTALQMADGDLVCWLNADDFHLPWTYEQVGHAFQCFPDATLVYGDTVFVDDDSRLTRLVPQPAFDRRVLEGGFNMFHVPSVFWRRSALPFDWTFDATMQLYMDLDLWLQLTRSPVLVVKIDAVLSAFRRHDAQVSAITRASDALEVRALGVRHDLPDLAARRHGGWSRTAHARHAFGKIRDGGALRQLSARRLRGCDLDWTSGATIPSAIEPQHEPRLHVMAIGG